MLCYICYAIIICSAMLCYAMLCYAMLCFAMLCYAMLCYAILCSLLCYAMLCYAMLRFAMLCYAMLYYAILCYTMLCYAMLLFVMLCYAMLRFALAKHSTTQVGYRGVTLGYRRYVTDDYRARLHYNRIQVITDAYTNHCSIIKIVWQIAFRNQVSHFANGDYLMLCGTIA